MPNYDESHKLFVAVEELTSTLVTLTSALIPDATTPTKIVLQDVLDKATKLQGIFAAQATMDIPAPALQEIRDLMQAFLNQ